MCLSIPSRVVAINEETNSATVDTMGVGRQVSLDLMGDPIFPGDYVLIHVGYVIGKIDEKDALESLRIYEEIIAKMDDIEGKSFGEEP